MGRWSCFVGETAPREWLQQPSGRCASLARELQCSTAAGAKRPRGSRRPHPDGEQAAGFRVADFYLVLPDLQQQSGRLCSTWPLGHWSGYDRLLSGLGREGGRANRGSEFLLSAASALQSVYFHRSNLQQLSMRSCSEWRSADVLKRRPATACLGLPQPATACHKLPGILSPSSRVIESPGAKISL